jgi:hypothetical protein
LIAMRIDLRLCTAVVMIGICAFSVGRGFSIAQFALAARDTDAVETRAQQLRAWTGVAGIGSTALKALVRAKSSPDWKAAESQGDGLHALVAIKPLSSVDWLALARTELATGQPKEQILDALMFSWVTGPNEGYVMAERGIMAVSLWEILPPDLKTRAAMDLANSEILDSRKLRIVLSIKPKDVRDEVRRALLSTRLSPIEVDGRLGL